MSSEMKTVRMPASWASRAQPRTLSKDRQLETPIARFARPRTPVERAWEPSAAGLNLPAGNLKTGGMASVGLLQDERHLLDEGLDIEAGGVRPASFRRVAAIVEVRDDLGQSLSRLWSEEDAGFAVDDRFQGSTGTERDHRATGSLSLDRRQAKIFLTRPDQRPTLGQQPLGLGLRYASQKLHRRSGE